MAYGDNISRQAAIDALWAERMKLSEEMERNLETCSFALRADNKARRNRVEEDIEIIKQLPPAQPEQRTGEYVHVSGYSDQYKCTACGIDIVPMRVVKFCPECGAKILKMISGERVRYPWEGANNDT